MRASDASSGWEVLRALCLRFPMEKGNFVEIPITTHVLPGLEAVGLDLVSVVLHLDGN